MSALDRMRQLTVDPEQASTEAHFSIGIRCRWVPGWFGANWRPRRLPSPVLPDCGLLPANCVRSFSGL